MILTDFYIREFYKNCILLPFIHFFLPGKVKSKKILLILHKYYIYFTFDVSNYNKNT